MSVSWVTKVFSCVLTGCVCTFTPSGGYFSLNFDDARRSDKSKPFLIFQTVKVYIYFRVSLSLEVCDDPLHTSLVTGTSGEFLHTEGAGSSGRS